MIGATPYELRSCKSIGDSINVQLIGGISYDTIHSLANTFGISGASVFLDRANYPDNPSITDIIRTFLLAGSYGDFPAITSPISPSFNQSTFGLVRRSKKFIAEYDLLNIVEHVCDDVPDIGYNDVEGHEGLYRVVHFLTCIRHEVMAADMANRDNPWNPIVSFEAPFYYKRGKMRNWVMDNNILRAEIIEFINNVFHMMLSTSWAKRNGFAFNNFNNKCPARYEFLLTKYTQSDVDRLKLFECLNSDETIDLACSMVTKMIRSLDLFISMFKRVRLTETKKRVTHETLLSSLQDMFNTLYSLENYVSSL